MNICVLVKWLHTFLIMPINSLLCLPVNIHSCVWCAQRSREPFFPMSLQCSLWLSSPSSATNRTPTSLPPAPRPCQQCCLLSFPWAQAFCLNTSHQCLRWAPWTLEKGLINLWEGPDGKSVVPPQPRFGFLRFPLPAVKCGLEAGDLPPACRKARSSLMMRCSACAVLLTSSHHVVILSPYIITGRWVQYTKIFWVRETIFI